MIRFTCSAKHRINSLTNHNTYDKNGCLAGYDFT